MQETFAKVLSKPRFLRNDDDLGYLLRVLRNTFVSRHRAAMRRPQSTPMPEELEPVDPSSATRPDSAVEAREVFAYIAALPESFRDALVAVDVVGLSYGEAAQAARHQGGHHHLALVPCARSGRSRDGSEPTRRPLRQAVVPPDQDIPRGPPRRRARRARPRAHRRRRGGDDGAARAARAHRGRPRPRGPERRRAALARPAGRARCPPAVSWPRPSSRSCSSSGGRERPERARHRCAGRPRPGAARAGGGQSNDAVLKASMDGVPFPYWGDSFQWEAVGARDDKIEDRSARTVFYDNPKGARAAYTILGGDTIDAALRCAQADQERDHAVDRRGSRPAHRDVDAQRPYLRAERPARRARAEAAAAGELEGQG